MKNLCFFCALICLGCQPKASEQKIETDSIEVATTISETQTEQKVAQVEKSPIYTYPATFRVNDSTNSFIYFLRPGSVIFKDSTFDSQEVLRIDQLTPVTVMASSSNLQPDGASICEQYFWYLVTMQDKTEGWIHGSGLLEDLTREPLTGEDFTLNGTTYTLYYFKDSGVGPSNSDGLTGCDEYVIPYFVNANQNTYHFIKVPDSTIDLNNLFISNYLNWVSFISNEGGGLQLQSIQYDEDTKSTLLKLSISYQDGGTAARMYILESGGNFELISFREAPEDSSENLN
jgi:hypothetical protein